jgi:hypothetical protein
MVLNGLLFIWGTFKKWKSRPINAHVHGPPCSLVWPPYALRPTGIKPGEIQIQCPVSSVRSTDTDTKPHPKPPPWPMDVVRGLGEGREGGRPSSSRAGYWIARCFLDESANEHHQPPATSRSSSGVLLGAATPAAGGRESHVAVCMPAGDEQRGHLAPAPYRQMKWGGCREGPLAPGIGSFSHGRLEHKTTLHKQDSKQQARRAYVVIFNSGSTTEPNGVSDSAESVSWAWRHTGP